MLMLSMYTWVATLNCCCATLHIDALRCCCCCCVAAVLLLLRPSLRCVARPRNTVSLLLNFVPVSRVSHTLAIVRYTRSWAIRSRARACSSRFYKTLTNENAYTHSHTLSAGTRVARTRKIHTAVFCFGCSTISNVDPTPLQIYISPAQRATHTTTYTRKTRKSHPHTTKARTGEFCVIINHFLCGISCVQFTWCAPFSRCAK